MCIRLLNAFIQVRQIHSNHYHLLYYSCRLACIAQQMKTQRLMNPSAKVQIIVAMEMQWWEGLRCPRQRTREKGSRERDAIITEQKKWFSWEGNSVQQHVQCVCVRTCKWISCNYSKMGLSGQEEECFYSGEVGGFSSHLCQTGSVLPPAFCVNTIKCCMTCAWMAKWHIQFKAFWKIKKTRKQLPVRLPSYAMNGVRKYTHTLIESSSLYLQR